MCTLSGNSKLRRCKQACCPRLTCLSKNNNCREENCLNLRGWMPHSLYRFRIASSPARDIYLTINETLVTLKLQQKCRKQLSHDRRVCSSKAQVTPEVICKPAVTYIITSLFTVLCICRSFNDNRIE